MSTIKWAACQPLVGGMTIAAYQILKTQPEFIITGFASNDQECINYFNNTLNLNVPVITMDSEYQGFLTNADETLFLKLNVNIDIVNYVPICSGLSALTTSCATCKVDNVQNENQYNLTKFILKNINPKIAVYENAPALYTESGKEVLEIINGIAKDNNYSLTVEKTDTFKHGIPQHRHRTFAYFFKDDFASYLEYEDIEPKTLTEYLKEIPKEATAQDIYADHENAHKDISYEFVEFCRDEYNKEHGTSENIYDMIARYGFNSKKRMSGYEFMERCTGFDKAIDWVENRVKETINQDNNKSYSSAHRNYIRMKEKVKNNQRYWDDSSVVSEPWPHVNAVTWKIMKQQKHPTEDRPLNIREYAWLMGMPHNFELANWDEWIKLSQNVPVSTSRHVAQNCILYVQNKLKKSSSKFIKQNNLKQKIDFMEVNKMEELEEW